MVKINSSDIALLCPNCSNPGEAADALQRAADKYLINTPLRVAAFLAQVAVESQWFNRVRENLYYTSAQRIRDVWPSRFADAAAAAPYVRNPEALANFVYANRMGNGSVQSGDGYRFRGGGYIMTTGRANYSIAESMLGIPLVAHPELIESRPVAAKTAGYYWISKGLNELADLGTDDAFIKITKLINGGTTGLAERQALYRQAKAIFV